MAKNKKNMMESAVTLDDESMFKKDEYSKVMEDIKKEPEVTEEYEVKLEAHRKFPVTHNGKMLIENLGGGDVHVNDTSTLYTGDAIEIENEAILYVTCYPKVKITKYR